MTVYRGFEHYMRTQRNLELLRVAGWVLGVVLLGSVPLIVWLSPRRNQ